MSESPPSPDKVAAKARGTAWLDDTELDDRERKVGVSSERGFLARYSRWSHDRPRLVFTSVFATIIIISVIVGAANLAEFNTDAGDKVRFRDLPETNQSRSPETCSDYIFGTDLIHSQFIFLFAR